MHDIKHKLNPSQLSAVETIHGPVLVIAGAGSGKTRAIEYRVLNLVQNGIKPDSILLLTFTRKAAREMLSRASKHDDRCKNVDGGTFHSFAFKLLKKYSKVFGFSDTFSILDEADSADAVHRCAVKLGLFKKEKRYPNKETMRKIISMTINKNVSVFKVLEKEYPHFQDYDKDIEEIRKEYIKYKISKSYLDYDDLLIYLKLLLENDEIRTKLSEKYKFIMVDEYQDTNKLQADIAYLLACKHKNIMVVGDDAQSIYGFRGAAHDNIMKFPDRFPECKIIKLEENYRSRQAILDLANAVLENMTNRYSKCLMSMRREPGQKPNLLFFKDPYDEAEWISSFIKKSRDEGKDLSRHAVLFRSAFISIPLQMSLSHKNIPFQVFGGLKFYETAHSKDIISHLKVMMNPKDEIAWHRILALIDGIGPKTAEQISSELIKRGELKPALDILTARSGKGSKISGGLKKLAAVLRSANRERLDVAERYEIVLNYYSPIMQTKFDDWHIRINDLEAIKQLASRYKTIEELLADFTIEPPEVGVWKVEAHTPPDERPLTLSTIHSAKGLEWEQVFMLGLSDGILPISFALDDDEEIEEERRLFYVAITRAKDELFLSLHHEGRRTGISQFNKLSRFIDEPNVLANINRAPIFEKDSSALFDDSGSVEDTARIYDKDTLFENIIDIFE